MNSSVVDPLVSLFAILPYSPKCINSSPPVTLHPETADPQILDSKALSSIHR